MVRKEVIQRALEEIVAEKRKVTRREVTDRLGGGSPNEIAPVIREFKETRRKKLTPEIVDLLERFWKLSPLDQKIFLEVIKGNKKKQ